MTAEQLCMRSRTAHAVESALCSFKGMVQLQYQVEPSRFAEGYAHEERQKAHKQWACLLEHGLLFVGPAPFGASDTFQKYGQAQCGGPQYGILAKKTIVRISDSAFHTLAICSLMFYSPLTEFTNKPMTL